MFKCKLYENKQNLYIKNISKFNGILWPRKNTNKTQTYSQVNGQNTKRILVTYITIINVGIHTIYKDKI